MGKVEEAREFLRQAKELTKEGEAIYDRAYDKVSSYASETEYCSIIEHISASVRHYSATRTTESYKILKISHSSSYDKQKYSFPSFL